MLRRALALGRAPASRVLCAAAGRRQLMVASPSLIQQVQASATSDPHLNCFKMVTDGADPVMYACHPCDDGERGERGGASRAGAPRVRVMGIQLVCRATSGSMLPCFFRGGCCRVPPTDGVTVPCLQLPAPSAGLVEFHPHML